MKTFLLKTVLLFAIIAMIDILIGICMKHVNESVMSGGQGRNNYIANELNADVVIFGSSRALHHYNTRLMQDSLGMTCYNCGEDANGILLDYARLWMMSKRYKPKYIIVDITPAFDMLKSTSSFDMGWLRPFYDDERIQKIFQRVDNKEKYKMLSSSYRYNSFFFMRIASYLSGKVEKDKNNGFLPKKSRFNRTKVSKTKDVPIEYDSLKIDYLNQFIQLSEGSHLIFVISPVWYDRKARRDEEIKPLKAICAEKGIPLIDFTNHPKYLQIDSLFSDGNHLNYKGADTFSNDIVNIIRQMAKP